MALREIIGNILSTLTQPGDTLEALMLQNQVALREDIMPPLGVPVEEFTEMSLYEAAQLIREDRLVQQRNQHVQDLFEAAKSGDKTAFGELAGIASGGNVRARELFKTIDGIPFDSLP